GLRDKGALESAIYHVFASFDGKDLYPSMEEKAARKAFAIIQSHPFVDGNKRVGLLVMLVFLELNGVELWFTQDELIDLGFSIAAGNKNDKSILDWINDHKS
ncbi:MAG: type II toxin-antitoxin system death-on-curing family toxin, partial [Christensenellales bacterium]